MAPKSLAQEVRAYTLGHARGYLDVADAVDDSDEVEDKNPVRSWKRVDDKVVKLGMELVVDDAVLQQLLPELLTEESGRQYYLGQGLGKGTSDVHRHWRVVRDAYLQLPGEPNVLLLVGFVHGLREVDAESANAIQDTLAENAKLDAHFPRLLGAPRSDVDGDRLIASMRRAVAKPHDYILRTQHNAEGGLSVAKFCEAMDELSQMEKGLIAAFDELGTELRRWKDREVAVPDELVLLSRKLLASFSFGDHGHNVAWRANELAKVAFLGSDAKDAASQFAARFAVALEDYRSRGDDYGDLACTLFRLQPFVALDAFLNRPNRKRRLGFRPRFVSRHGPVVQCAPEDFLMQWVSAQPETRAAVLACEINIFEKKKTKESASSLDEGATTVTLSPLAARLLELAPDKASVLQSFNLHLHPTHWSGSLGQTLAPYQALLEGLLGHADSAIVAWAHGALEVMRQRIANDRARDIRGEQSFE